MNGLVSVIIPTCGKQNYFAECLASLRRQTHVPLEVLVINNANQPGLTKEIFKAYPSSRIIDFSENLYYGPALNKGIEVSQGEFVLCLNDDVFLENAFIEEALKGFELDERVGMVCGKLLRPDRETIDSTGLFLTSWYGVRERGYGQKDAGQFDKPGPLFGVGGAAAFYRKKMLEGIKEKDGWFDPRFRMFFEDADLSWRARKCGWKAYYVSSAIAYHVRGGSARTPNGEGKKIARRYLPDDLQTDLIVNRYQMILKNEHFWGFFFRLVPVILYELYSWGYLLFFRPKSIGKFFEKNSKTRPPGHF